MKLDQELIKWVQQKLDEVCKGSGFGHVAIILYIKDGKLDGAEKRTVQTVKA